MIMTNGIGTPKIASNNYICYLQEYTQFSRVFVIMHVRTGPSIFIVKQIHTMVQLFLHSIFCCEEKLYSFLLTEGTKEGRRKAMHGSVIQTTTLTGTY